MQMRLFGVLVVSLFVLTLLFAVAAGAQEESAAEETTVLAADAADRKVEAETDNVSVKVDNGEVSVSTDDGSSSDDGTSQQSSLTVQQNQTDEGSGSRASTGDVNINQRTTTQATTDLNGKRAEIIEGTDSDKVGRVVISGLRSCEESSGTVRVSVRQEDTDGRTTAYFTDGENTDIEVDSGKVVITPDHSRNLTVPDGFDPGTGKVTSSSGIRCGNDNNNNGGGGGGGGGGISTNDLNCDDFSSQADAQAELDSDTSDPNNLDADNDGTACEDFNFTINAAQNPANPTNPTTNPTSPASPTATADPQAQTANDGSNSARSGDNFRCVDILRIARNPGRGQYISSQHFEECLSGDVLANTIPNRRLPGTGGPLPLLFGGALLAAGLALGGRLIKRS